VDLRQIKELMAVMEKTGTSKLQLKQEKFELVLERPSENSPPNLPDLLKHVEGKEDRLFQRQDQSFFKGAAIASAPMSHQPKPSGTHDGEGNTGDQKAKKGEVVKSPMVGTFYLSPSPDDPPFVKVGDSIAPDSILCIIEAMKVMNEIKAGMKGRLAEILVENSQPVEFGTPLFRIEP
jgi:acetyl-CoA carboxylase biotin carboxyl carrier protein